MLVLVALMVLGAYVLGDTLADRRSGSMWRDHGYCPTCDRLTTEQEGER